MLEIPAKDSYQISAKDGLEVNHGNIIPEGTRIGFPLQAIHHDASLYPDPFRFNPFRFSGMLDASHPGDQPSVVAQHTPSQEKCVNVNERFLTWGFGRHACPGRFFASQMMSLALAYIVQNYDIQSLTERTKSYPVLNILMPPSSATIRIRRRKI